MVIALCLKIDNLGNPHKVAAAMAVDMPSWHMTWLGCPLTINGLLNCFIYQSSKLKTVKTFT